MDAPAPLTALALKCVLKNPHSAFPTPAHAEGIRAPALRRRLLRGLSLAHAHTDALLPAAFFRTCGLRVLSFAGCSKVTPAFLLAACPPELLGLDLASCFALDDATLRALLLACPGLRYLNVTDCRRLTEGAVAAMVQHGGALRHVDLGGCTSISAGGVARLVAEHPGARAFVGLGLSGVAGVGPELLGALAARCTRLQRLALGYYAGPAAPLVELLRANAESLVALECHWSRAVTDDVAMALTGAGGAFGQLRLLNLQGAKAISLDGLCAIVSMHPRRAGAPPAEWDASDLLEWRALAGLPRKAMQEALAASACSGGGSSSSSSGGGGGGGEGGMDEEAEEVQPGLLRKLGVGLAHLTCRFSCPDGGALPHLRDHCQKLVAGGAGGVVLD
jgi:hypothetical protein